MNVKNGMRPVHPGESLREELDELGLSANALSKALGVPVTRVTTILNGQRGVSADTALRLAAYFGTTRPRSANGRRGLGGEGHPAAEGLRLAAPDHYSSYIWQPYTIYAMKTIKTTVYLDAADCRRLKSLATDQRLSAAKLPRGAARDGTAA